MSAAAAAIGRALLGAAAALLTVTAVAFTLGQAAGTLAIDAAPGHGTRIAGVVAVADRQGRTPGEHARAPLASLDGGAMMERRCSEPS